MKAKKKKDKSRDAGMISPYEPVTGKELEVLNDKRRARDGLPETGDGFMVKDDGFSGTIYYRQGSRILEAAFQYWDMGNRQILVDPRGLRQWILPTMEPVSDEVIKQIESLLFKTIAHLGGTVLFGKLTRLYKNGSQVGMQGDPEARTTIRLYEPMSEKDRNKYERQRRRKDGVPNLDQGFTERSEGRTGVFYYCECTKILEFGWEFSGGPEAGGILIPPDAFKKWFHPTVEPVEPGKQVEIKEAFISMAKAKGGIPIFSESSHDYFSISGKYATRK